MRWTATLEGLLQSIGRRRFVVVTDRYPPDAHGGAEVSLHIAVRALAMGDELLVVTFGDRNPTARRYRVDGVDVLCLPRQGRWPLHRTTHASTMPLGRLPDGVRQKARGAVEAAALRLSGGSARAEAHALGVTLREQVRPRGGPVVDFLEYPDGAGARLLRRVLERCQPAVAHADNYRAILTLAEASRGMELARVGVVRDNRFHCVRYDQSVRVGDQPCETCRLQCAEHDAPGAPALQREALRRAAELRVGALRQMDRVVVTSRYLRDAIAPLVDEERIVRIPNTPDEVAEVRRHVRGVGELPGTNLLVVGMLNENKGQLELVKRLDRLVARVPDVRVHFAGRGERIERAMRRAAEKKSLSSRLVFHGYVERGPLYRLYRECQIVALPTVWPEPFGRVPLEAGVTRRPAVSFAVGGLRESIEHEVTGLLVPAGDYPALLAALGRLADDPGLRRRMGEAAERHILATYRIDDLQRRLRKTWAGLTGSG